MGKQKYYDINNRVKRLYLFTLRPYTIPVLVLVLLLTGLIVFNSSLTRKHALAASYTWDGGGSTNNWSECTNWSTDICPTSADSVTFNGTSTKDSTVDASFGGVVLSVAINSGYTGTLSLARSLNTTTSFAQAAGSFTASNQTLDVDTTLSVTGGTFTAPSTTLFMSGLTVSGSPTFNHNGGSITVDGSSSQSLTCNSVTFNLIIFAHTAGIKTVNSGCTLPLGNNPTVGSGSAAISLNGTLTGTGTMTVAGAYTRNTGSSVTGFTGIVANGAYTIAGATVDQSTYTTVDYNSTFTMSSGTYTATAGTATFASTFTISGGTFNANGGTITFDGSANVTLACNNQSFNLVTISRTGDLTVGSSCSLPLGNGPTISMSTKNLTLNGTLTGTGTMTITGSGSNYIRNAGSTVTGFTGIVVGGTYTVAGATVDQSAYTTADYNGIFTMSSGSFTAPAGSMTLASGFTLTGGTFNANGGTVTFDGAASATLSCNSATFNLVTFAHTAGAKTVSSNCSLPLGNNPIINAGSAIALSGTLSGSGTLTDGATLTLNTGAALSGFSGIAAAAFTNAGATTNLGSYSSFSASGAVTLSSGSLTLPNGADLNGNFVISGGTFNAPSGTMTMAGVSFTTSGSFTFNANGGIFTFDSALGQTLTCAAGTNFNLVILNRGASNLTVGSGCSLPLGANPTINGNVVLNGTLTGSGTITANNNYTRNTGSTVTGFTGIVVTGTYTIAGANVDQSTYTTADYNSTFSLTSGSFTASSGITTIAGNFTISSGSTFNASGGTIVFDGTNSAIDCDSAVFSNIGFANTSGTKLIRGNCTLPLGANPTIGAGGDITNNGTLTGSGTLTTSNTLSTQVGSSLSGFSGLVTGGDLIAYGGTSDFSTYTTLDINGNLTIYKPDSFTAPSGTMTLAGDLNIPSDDGHLYLPGNTGDYASAPDSAALSITGNITVDAKVAFNDWTPSVAFTQIASKIDTTTTRSYSMVLSGSGVLQFNLSNNGTASVLASSTVATGLADRSTKWVRASWNDATDIVQFFLSDDGTTWTQLGTDVSLVSAGIFDSGSPLQIGATQLGSSPMTGNIYNVRVYASDLGSGSGTPVFDADFTNHADGTTSFTESSSNAATVTLNGSTAKIVSDGAGTFDPNGGTVLLDGSSAQTIPQSTDFFNLSTSNSAGLTLSTGTTQTVAGTTTFAGPVTVAGTLSGNGTLSQSSGTLLFNNGSVLSGYTGLVADDLTLDDTTLNFGSYSTLDINDDLTIQNNATLTLASATTTIGGDINLTTGSTLTPNSGTVLLDGSSQTLSGSLTFYNLTKTVSSASTLTFPASTTTTIQNNLTLSGTTGQLLSLVSSSPSTQWRINVGGSDNLNYLDITDSYNQGSLLTACYSTDSGNNFNWSIKPGTCTTSTGGGGTTGGSSGGSTTTGTGGTTGTGTSSTDSSSGSGSPLIPKDDNPPDELTPPNSFLDNFRKKVTGSEKTDWNYKKIIAYGLGILVLLWILILIALRLLKRREGYYNG